MGNLEMRKLETRISIIVPIFNAEMFLVRCISSIQNQTHENLQIILIDDGSTDSSLNICKQIAQSDSRIEFYHIENQGSVVARKIGLEVANGEYVGFVDADDYIEAEMFSELLYKINQYDADFVHSGYVEEIDGIKKNICNFDETVADIDSFESKIIFLQRYILSQTDKDFISPSLWSKLFKRDFIKKCYNCLSDEQQYGEDLICLCRCIMESHRIVLSKDAKYHYLVRKNTLSHLEYLEYMKQEIGLWKHLIKTMEEYHCFEELNEDLYNFLKRRMIYVILADEKKGLQIPHYFYKDIKQISGKKIIIFGAGDVGQNYYSQICKYKSCEIVAWMDSKWDKYHFDYAKVVGIENIHSLQYDMIIIAVRDKDIGIEIKNLLVSFGVPEDKISWQEVGRYY